tara:strand:+ start:670 stop:1284 length:615 start_codon:yes stop_codon:yes gene_type:complete
MNEIQKIDFSIYCKNYVDKLGNSFTEEVLTNIEQLSKLIKDIWINGKRVFICGNGGSSANAQHVANDFIYGIGNSKNNVSQNIKGVKIEALTSNSNIITCLANDIGYENIFSYQLDVKASSGDLLIVLSGSGNSPNVINALKMAKKKGLHSCAILGYSGGLCKELCDLPIHFEINDMEISEDCQMIIFNIIKQWLIRNKPNLLS